MMTLWSCPCVKHFADFCFVATQAASTGMHCKIQMRDSTTFERIKNTTRLWMGLMIRLLGEMRSKSKQIDTLVAIRVKKV